MALDGTATIVPGGIVTPLENVKGRTTRRVSRTWRYDVSDRPANGEGLTNWLT